MATFAEDYYLYQEVNGIKQPTGVPTTSAGAVLSPTIAASTNFVSKWYTKNNRKQHLSVIARGSDAFNVIVEEAMEQDGTPLTRSVTTAAAALGADFAVNLADHRVLGKFWRVTFNNGGAQQADAAIYVLESQS